MRRALLVVFVAAAAVLALAVPASANSVTRHQFRDTFALSEWRTSLPYEGQDLTVTVSGQHNAASSLYVAWVDVHYSPVDGTWVSETTTTAYVSSGFSEQISSALTDASVTATALPAQTCDADSSGGLICSDTTVDVSVSWTGVGAVERSRSTYFYHFPGFRENGYVSGTLRSATATGTWNGVALGTATVAELGTDALGGTTVCIGKTC